MNTIQRICLGFTALLFTACVNPKQVTYFNNLGDSVISRQAEDLSPAIQKNDILQITVSSMSPEASASFNMIPVGTAANANTSPFGGAGYLVNEDGLIQFPFLGNMKVAGLTKKELTSLLTKQLAEKKLLVDPIVTVRKTNFHVTVLGEVARPAVIPVPNERINIVEAIGMAGDLTIYAKRNNVLLIREEAGVKLTKRINLNSGDILTSPYYNLRSNDIVYVEPSKTKISSASQSRQILPLILSGLSVVAIVLDRVL